jgi:hypothetical protein
VAEFHLIPVTQALHVEGSALSEGIGSFKGYVIALAVRGLDPVAAPEPSGDGPDQTEGLLGWGTTHMLVADPERAAPIWVSKDELTAHRLDDTSHLDQV